MNFKMWGACAGRKLPSYLNHAGPAAGMVHARWSAKPMNSVFEREPRA